MRREQIREHTFRARAAQSKFGNVSGARTSPGVVVYQSSQGATHIIIAGTLFPWAEKAPYVRSGKSVLGAIEYDEKADRIKCHECGGWFESVGAHIIRSHDAPPNVGSRVYRAAHGLTDRTPLCTPRVSSLSRRGGNPDKRRRWSLDPKEMQRRAVTALTARRAAGEALRPRKHNPEQANLHSRCRAQLEVRMMALYRKLGRCPTTFDLKTAGIVRQTVIRVWGGMKMKDIYSNIGIPWSHPQHIATSELIAYIQERVRELGRVPSCRELSSDFISDSAIRARFGGISNAFAAAGIEITY